MGYKKSQISIGHIVEAAMRVLARQGYARTSLMDIANEVGMSKGAVHYHFPTKEALMAKVLQTACDTVAERTRDAWTNTWKTSGNPADALQESLRELWRARAGLSDEAKVVADLLAQSLHDPNLRAPLAEYYRFAGAQVEKHLMDNLGALGLRPKLDPTKVPRLLHALLDGLMMQKIVDPDSVTENDVLEALGTMAAALFETVPVQGR